MRVAIPILSIAWHGGCRVLVQIANHLAAHGHDVTVLTSKGRVSSPFRFHEKVKVRHLGTLTRWKYLDYFVFLLLLAMRAPRGSLLLATFFVTYYPVRLAALIHGNPYLYFVQDVEAKYRGLRGAILNFVCNLTYKDDRIVTANPHLRVRLAREYRRETRSISIGPGAEFYRPQGGGVKQYDVLHFVRAEPWKGLDRFLRFLELSNGRLKCLCVSQNEELFRAVSRLGVTCRKPADDAELISCIDSARVLFFTSYAEGFALPPLEAMARGVPSVLFRCGGPDMYISNGVNSVYVESEEQAVEVIGKLVSDETCYKKMSEAGITTAAAYRMDAALDEFMGILAQVSRA